MSHGLWLWHDDVRRPPPCAGCGGEGTEPIPEDADPIIVIRMSDYPETCDRCDGTGTEWTWVRDNGTARAVLAEFEVEMLDLDHDLGGHELDPDAPDAIYYRGNVEDNGMALVDWMIQTGFMPHFIRIHSWNPAGAQNMMRALRAAGHQRVRYRPYQEGGAQKMAEILKHEVESV